MREIVGQVIEGTEPEPGAADTDPEGIDEQRIEEIAVSVFCFPESLFGEMIGQ